jgi:uncharacterized protein YkwD
MSDPFGFDDVFSPRCPVCGSSSCGGCSEKSNKSVHARYLLITAGVIGGLIAGLLLGFVFFRESSIKVIEPSLTVPSSITVSEGTTSTTVITNSSFFPTNQDEELMLSLVNQVRQDNGTSNLTWCPALVRSSLAHSQDMSAQNYFEHDSPDGGTIGDRAIDAGYRYRAVGENIAFGQRTVRQVMEAWIDSPGHFENLISPAYEHFGYAEITGRLNGSSGKFWTQNFGAGGACD